MRAVRVAIAALVGLGFWYFVAPLYAPVTRTLARLFVPIAFGHGYTLGGDADAIVYTPVGLIASRVFMRDVTTNLITLIALFGLARHPFSASNLGRCAIGIVCLIPVHALAILIVAKSFVAPPGSLWGNAAQAYAVFACHAISFALWWLLRPGDTALDAAPAV